MKTIQLDAKDWKSEEDFYVALLPELGAPEWHGHNRDALWDSIAGGDINSVLPPFSIDISNVNANLVPLLQKVEALFKDARSEGVDVQFEFRSKDF